MKATVDITSKCNLRCKHCYNNDKYFKSPVDELSDEEMMRLVRSLAENGFDELNILGGEPLLRNNIVDILRAAHNSKMFVSLTTNGTMIDNSKFEAIFEENLVDNLIFSLDGANAESNNAIRGKGVFDKLMYNLKIINRWKIKHDSSVLIGISYCILENQIDINSHELIDVCKRGNINTISFFGVIEAGAALEHNEYFESSKDRVHAYIEQLIKYAEKEYPELVFSIEERPNVAEYFNLKFKNSVLCPDRHIGCGVFNGCIYIKADGTILPCGFVEFKKGFMEQKMGSFSEEDNLNIKRISDYSEVYSAPIFRDFMSSFLRYRREEYNKICNGCRYKKRCTPCAYQNKKGEIFAECIDIFPKLQAIIEESQGWEIKKIFSNRKIDLLFGGMDKCNLRESYQISKFTEPYREFLNTIVEYEKRGLIKVNRGENKK